MANAPPYAQMRAQFDSLIDAGWATPCLVTRAVTTPDATGELGGTFTTVSAAEKLWIQAIAGRTQVGTQNLDAETTHLCFQKRSGFALLPKDRILPSGATYAFDVKRAHMMESHRMAELKQDLRQ